MSVDDEDFGKCNRCYNAHKIFCRCAPPNGDYAMGCKLNNLEGLMDEECKDFDCGGYQIKVKVSREDIEKMIPLPKMKCSKCGWINTSGYTSPEWFAKFPENIKQMQCGHCFKRGGLKII